MDRGVVPPWATKLTAFIDVQDRLLYYVVAAWSDTFGGAIIDYGTHPEQNRSYYTYADARKTLDQQHENTSRTGAIYSGLVALINQLCGRVWYNIDKTAEFQVERMMVDAGHERNVVYDAIRNSAYSVIVTPSFGRGIKAGDNPMIEWKRNPGEEVGHHWRRRTAQGEGVRYVLFDANHWKTRVQHALNTADGDPGSLALYSDRPTRHQMIAEHLAAETAHKTEGRGRELVEWKLVDKTRDNHLLDCVVGSAVAASILGIKTAGDRNPVGRVPANQGRKRKRPPMRGPGGKPFLATNR